MSGGERAIYVGDDVERRDGLERVLEGTGLVLGGSMATARAAADVGGPAPSIALLDAVPLACEAAVAGLGLLAAVWPQAAVVVMHDDTEPAVVRSLLDAGAASIVRSTTPAGRLRATIESARDGHGLVELDVVRPVIDLYATLHAQSRRRNRAVIESLAAAVEAKDSVTSRHLHAVSRLATQLAGQIDPDLVAGDDFLFGCLLHDVGKIGVPEHILSKPAPLTSAEWRIMRRHPQTGATVVRPLNLSPVVTDVVLYHHERWDGRGYPEGLADHEIPLPARIFSVCDALEAMTARRPYRAPMPVEVALECVRLEAGQQFDPEVVEALDCGVSSGEVDLSVAAGLDVDEPRRRRLTSSKRGGTLGE